MCNCKLNISSVKKPIKYMSEKELVSIWVTPLYYFFGIKLIYVLPDMSYGQYLIFENNYPKYYFNYFDKYYDAIRIKIDNSKISHELLLKKSFQANNPLLSLRQKSFGIRFENKSYNKIF